MLATTSKTEQLNHKYSITEQAQLIPLPINISTDEIITKSTIHIATEFDQNSNQIDNTLLKTRSVNLMQEILTCSISRIIRIFQLNLKSQKKYKLGGARDSNIKVNLLIL